jgi:hypothetical protein
LAWLAFTLVISIRRGAQDRRRVCDGMHAFVYTPVFGLVSFSGGLGGTARAGHSDQRERERWNGYSLLREEARLGQDRMGLNGK